MGRRFEGHDEAAPGLLASQVPRVAAVSARDLAHQRQPQSGPGALPTVGKPVERTEHTLALSVRNARPMVTDAQLGPALGAAHAHVDGRRAVASRVLQEIPDHPAQQARVAAHGDRLTGELCLLVARALFARKREKIYLLVRFPPLDGVQATSDQNLVDQRVELRDVLLETALAPGIG